VLRLRRCNVIGGVNMDLLGKGRAERRQLKAGLLMSAGMALVLSISPISVALAADDNAAMKAQLDALTQQLKALAAQNQAQSAQMKALNDQVQKLQAAPVAAAATGVTVTAPGVAPTFDQSNVAVTQSPGNLPGLSGVGVESVINPYLAGQAKVDPNYTGSAVSSAPFAGATGTNPVAAGNPVVRLSLSGQVDRQLLYGDDGHAREIRNVDNNISSTRFRFIGESWINPQTSAGAYIELEIRPNSSANTALTTDTVNSPTNFSGSIAGVGSTTGAVANNTTGTPTVRWADSFISNTDWGTIHLGWGATSGYLASEIDMSGTFYAGYVNAPDFDGGFSFRQKGQALVPVGTAAVAAVPAVLVGPGGAATGPATIKTAAVPAKAANATALVLSPDNAFGPTVSSMFFFMDGLVRTARLRYDSPLLYGFTFSASAIDGGATDLGFRYGGNYFGTQVAASGAVTFATSLNHAAPAAYAYSSGIPPAGTTPSALITQNGAPPLSTSSAANGSTQFNGSVGILHPSGFNLSMAGGYQQVIYQDPLKQNLSPDLFFVKAGYRTMTPWFSIGPTAFAVSYLANDDLLYHGDEARDYGVEFEQEILSTATSLYAGYHHQTLHREFGTYRPIDAISTGAIVRF
jgi:hypothetical protein